MTKRCKLLVSEELIREMLWLTGQAVNVDNIKMAENGGICVYLRGEGLPDEFIVGEGKRAKRAQLIGRKSIAWQVEDDENGWKDC